MLLLVATSSFAGSLLLLPRIRWFQHTSLSRRIAPYVPHGDATPLSDPFSADSLLEVIGPLAQSAGAQLSRLLGVEEETSVRLTRIHSPLGVGDYRIRQFAWALAAFAAGTAIAVIGALPPPFAFGLVVAFPALAFVVIEHRLARRSADWQRRTVLELPVVVEQLGMLLDAGQSLGSSLQRIAQRGNGVVPADLARVCQRMRHGLTEVDALMEWSVTVRVEAVDRLVAVLAVHAWAGNASDVLTQEARSIRSEVHRRLLSDISRRSQMVWIPVTVAALVPGTMLMSVPFIDAMHLFTQGSG